MYLNMILIWDGPDVRMPDIGQSDSGYIAKYLAGYRISEQHIQPDNGYIGKYLAGYRISEQHIQSDSGYTSKYLAGYRIYEQNIQSDDLLANI